jgi:hypothetical protein
VRSWRDVNLARLASPDLADGLSVDDDSVSPEDVTLTAWATAHRDRRRERQFWQGLDAASFVHERMMPAKTSA